MSYIDNSRSISRSGRDVLIRNAHTSDAGAILEIKNGVISEQVYMLRETDEANLSTDSEQSDILDHLGKDGSVYIVAESGEQVLGFIEFLNGSLKRTRHSGMFSVYIRKDYRGDGIGSLLLGELLKWAERHPLIEKITLAVFSTNSKAIELYRKFGFDIEGYCPRDMKLSDGTYINSVLMYRFVK